MRRVRKKLLIAHGEIAEGAIKSVWGVGYQLCITIVLR
jgi:DNA-binding response OmpR family regulator